VRKSVDRLVVALLCAFALASHAPHAWAGPLAGHAAGGRTGDVAIVIKVHGFHCRKELGWDPNVGLYRYHRHEGICRDYKRCLRQHHRCILDLGRGWTTWKYEDWGWENWRYTSCMMRNTCY